VSFRGESFAVPSLNICAMPKLRLKRRPNSILMGAGAVLGGFAAPAPNPELRDALALHRDQVALAEDLWGAIEVFDATLEPDIANSPEEPLEQND